MNAPYHTYASQRQEEIDRAEYRAMVRQTLWGLLAIALGFIWVGWAILRIINAAAHA